MARWPVGGIRSYFRYSYGLLPPEDFDLALVGPASNDLKECETALAKFAPRIYPARSASLLHLAETTWRAISAEEPDLLHAQGYSSALAVGPLARLRGLPQIVTLHDMFTDAIRKQLKVRIGRIALSAALGCVDVVQPTGIAVEENYRKHMSFWPATRPRLTTIRNGIDTARFAGTDARDLRAELELRPDDFVIGFLGRFMAIKGFHCLVKAIEHLVRTLNPPRRPVVVAVGSGGFIREDREFIEARQLQEHVKFLGHTNAVAATLRGLDVVVVPSYSEASPILPMEALVSGVPVIASDPPGLRDVLSDTPASLFPIGDAPRLAALLLDYMLKPRKDVFLNFRPAAIERYDATRSASQLRQLIDGIVGARSRPDRS